MRRSVWRPGLAPHWRREVLRTNLWLVPAIEVVAALVVFAGTFATDRAAYRGAVVFPSWATIGSADAARQILTAVAAAVITVVGVVFSIILVTLTLASTQFGPRMLRNFIRDPGTQLTLGTFVATFVYAVLVLVSIGPGSHGDFVPHLGVTVTLALIVADLAVLIYFIHHIAISVQLPQVIASIAADLSDAIETQGGEGGGARPARGYHSGPTTAEILSRLEAGGCDVLAPASGYLQSIRHRNLVRLAAGAHAVISLDYRPGHFIVQGHRVASVWPPEAGARISEALGRAHFVGPYRTLTQDISFAVDQLVEIALRALGPATSDIFTAMTCVDWLGDNLCKITRRWHPVRVHRDDRGVIRVIAPQPDYERLVQRAFEKIRQASAGMPAVMIRQLEAIAKIMAETSTEGQRRVLLDQAAMIDRACERSVPEAADRADVRRRYEAVLTIHATLAADAGLSRRLRALRHGAAAAGIGHAWTMRRGKLRIYLGAAPGVGKTYAMLGEGHRRLSRGTDVVVAFAETYGRRLTAQMIEGLEIIPRRVMPYRGTTFEEMDIDAVLRRRPAVALVDELAHTNVPGSRNEKRWQDAEELLDAGIDVISTVNIQHLESLNDVVQKITGVRQRETIPDAVVRSADQIELADQTPEALRRRMAHGNIYPPEKIDAALSNYFRTGNLTALRELALLWLADRVDEGLQRYREEHGIGGVWEARERVVVALTGGPEGAALLRRGARIAARSARGDLLAVHVARSDGLTGADPAMLSAQRRLVESVGGSYHQVVGDDVPAALLDFARAENATQLVLGASRHSWLGSLLTGPGTGFRTIRGSGDIDVHIVTHGEMGRGTRLPRLRGSLSLRRRIYGFVLAAVLGPVLTAALAPVRGQVNLISDTLAFLVVVVVVALTGGLYPAIFAAVGLSLLLNYYFIPPLHTFTIAAANNLAALLVFVVVAIAVSTVVDLAARRTRQAARASAESQTLATLAGSVLRGERGVTAMLEHVREAFGMNSATLLERAAGSPAAAHRGPGSTWSVVGSAGSPPVSRPEDADVDEPVGDDLCLALRGRPLPAEDRSVLAAFAVHVAVLWEQRRLAEAAQAAKPIAEADRMRTALLAAVSHDLRTPLAAAKTSLSGLRSGDVSLDSAEAGELVATADESVDRLARLVDNLLDASRLQAGALSVTTEPTALDEIVASALDELGPAAAGVTVTIPATLPPVLADPALLERVAGNLLSNAIRYSPPSAPPSVTASALGGRVELRVIDRGPGIPDAERDRMFTPFQRLGDPGGTGGTGLGLALSRGLAEAMDGTLSPEETPGGGLTMTVSLPAADGCGPARPDGAPSGEPAAAGPGQPAGAARPESA